MNLHWLKLPWLVHRICLKSFRQIIHSTICWLLLLLRVKLVFFTSLIADKNLYGSGRVWCER